MFTCVRLLSVRITDALERLTLTYHIWLFYVGLEIELNSISPGLRSLLLKDFGPEESQ